MKAGGQMRRMFLAILVMTTLGGALAQESAKAPATLRSILLEQMRASHNNAEWFTPGNKAVAGLTAEQARWIPKNAAGKTDPNANHSTGMLAAHLVFWNERALMQLQGKKPAPAPANEETFNSFNPAQWNDIVNRMDAVMTSMEQWTEKAGDADLQNAMGTLSHTAAHNAYHIGQILYVRKLQGSWNPANGVK